MKQTSYQTTQNALLWTPNHQSFKKTYPITTFATRHHIEAPNLSDNHGNTNAHKLWITFFVSITTHTSAPRVTSLNWCPCPSASATTIQHRCVNFTGPWPKLRPKLCPGRVQLMVKINPNGCHQGRFRSVSFRRRAGPGLASGTRNMWWKTVQTVPGSPVDWFWGHVGKMRENSNFDLLRWRVRFRGENGFQTRRFFLVNVHYRKKNVVKFSHNLNTD